MSPLISEEDRPDKGVCFEQRLVDSEVAKESIVGCWPNGFQSETVRYVPVSAAPLPDLESLTLTRLLPR
jgi:hypothetical protein